VSIHFDSAGQSAPEIKVVPVSRTVLDAAGQ
jgi:hypothetical protein